MGRTACLLLRCVTTSLTEPLHPVLIHGARSGSRAVLDMVLIPDENYEPDPVSQDTTTAFSLGRCHKHYCGT
jgi:hypothetical protein